MGRIEKEKNIIKIWVDGKNKPYVLDINAGVLVGLTGKELQTIPPMLASAVHSVNMRTSVIALLRYSVVPHRYANLYRLADRVDALGICLSYGELNRIQEKIEAVNLKDLADHIANGGSCGTYLQKVLRNNWAVKMGLEADDHLTEPMINFLYDNYADKPKEVISRFAYYLTRGLWEFFGKDRYRTREYLSKYYAMTEEMGVPMEKGDFFRNYINTQRAYTAFKDRQLDNAIAQHQQSHLNALTYENDTYIVVVPMTNEELRIEGERQRNCVGGYGKSIAEKRRNVVFIRRKSDPSKNYITCDIYNGHIDQYLTFANNQPNDADAIAFKQAYQNHLRTHWGE